jgi:hypothetical protein
VIKEIMRLAKVGYGRVDEVSYWVDFSQGQGVFPKGSIFKPCEVDEVVIDKESLGMGFMTYTGF